MEKERENLIQLLAASAAGWISFVPEHPVHRAVKSDSRANVPEQIFAAKCGWWLDEQKTPLIPELMVGSP